MSDVRPIFEFCLRERGVAFTIRPDGRYAIEHEGGILEISLDNVARDFARDGDPAAVRRFVDRVFASFEEPAWEEARTRVYFSAEPSDADLGASLHEPVTETVTKVLVLVSPEAGTLRYLTQADVERWGVSAGAVTAQANQNLDRLLEGKRPDVERFDGFALGMIPLDSFFKSSVLFAPSFRRFVERDLGWPVLVTVPCRDFVYVIPEKDQELLGRMGAVVQEEFRNSGYPITTEVLRFSDAGIDAIGDFPR